MSLPLKTVAFVDDEPAIVQVLDKACEGHYQIVGRGSNGLDAVTLVRTLRPQVLVLDFQIPEMNGLEVLKQVVPLQTTAVIIITAALHPEIFRQAMVDGASGCMSKPFELAQVVPMLETAWHHFQGTQAFQKEIATLSETLETRKLLEKAKGILMQQQGYTEDDAHRTLQKMSQDQAISLKEVCRSLLQVQSLLGKAAKRNAA